MKFLGKKFGRRDDDEDLDLDLDLDPDLDQNDEDDLGSADSEDQEAGGGRGLFRKFLRKRKGNDQDDGDPAEDAEPLELDVAPPVQRVQIEGIADVRPVGGAPGSMTPVTQPTEGGQAESPPATETAPQEQQEADDGGDTGGEDGPQDDTDSDDDKDESGLDFSLKDLFQEVVEVDESLKDLADSQESVTAADLARELREFLAELETEAGD